MTAKEMKAATAPTAQDAGQREEHHSVSCLLPICELEKRTETNEHERERECELIVSVLIG